MHHEGMYGWRLEKSCKKDLIIYLFLFLSSPIHFHVICTWGLIVALGICS